MQWMVKRFKVSIFAIILNLVFVLVENGYAPRKYVLKDTETLNPIMWMRRRRRRMRMRVQRRTLTLRISAGFELHIIDQ